MQLYVKGKGSLDLFDHCMAIVGSRRMSSYGEAALEKLLPGIIAQGYTIVSGFMYGVDQKAHELAIEYGGNTIAVLGWGIDWQVEERDKKLYERILDNGLIVSEYEGQTPPRLWMFPQRNKIIAGISEAVLIVEAAFGSGSLITAKYAKQYKKKLFAVPGPITSKLSEGTNDLIKTGKAEMFTGMTASVGDKQVNNPILKLLEAEPLGVDELARKLKMPVELLGVELSSLQLSGEVEEREGKYCLVGSH